jgi:hypothetical protein
MTQTTRLASSGPNFIAAVHPVAYIVNRTYETLISINKHEKRRRKSSPRAWTTPDTLLRPFIPFPQFPALVSFSFPFLLVFSALVAIVVLLAVVGTIDVARLRCRACCRAWVEATLRVVARHNIMSHYVTQTVTSIAVTVTYTSRYNLIFIIVKKKLGTVLWNYAMVN